MRIDEFITPDGSISSKDKTRFMLFGFDLTITISSLVKITSLSVAEYFASVLSVGDNVEQTLSAAENYNMVLSVEDSV